MQRVVVVGGGIRGSMFAAEIQRRPDAEVVGICEPDATVRARLADGLAVAVHGDLETLLASSDATAAVIATPDHLHRDAAITCLAAGLDLLVEKPLATTTVDAEAIVTAARTHGRRVCVGFENRWNPRFTATRQQVRDGGAPVIHQIVQLNDTIFVPTQMLSWAAASSPGWFLFPHALDLAMWLGDAHPVAVRADGVRRVLASQGIDTWDAISATFTMADSSLVTLHSSWVLPTGMPMVFDFRYEIQTTDANLRLDISDSGIWHTDATAGRWVHPAAREGRHILTGGPLAMVNDWLDALDGADLVLPDADQGLAVTRAIEAVHTSLTTGETVRIPSPTQNDSHDHTSATRRD